MKYRPLARLWTMAFIMSIALQATAASKLYVSDAWVREAPPGASVMAAYMTINNPGKTAANVTAVSGKDFSSIEIHRSIIENGMARMDAADRLEIPANGSFTLEPGGYHLMLFNPQRALAEGDSVKLLLHIDNQQCIAIDVPVKRMITDKHP